ncbi:transcriptional regulator [Pantoea sp. VS1]|nr:winged helix-turn-helix domain-containing protein [Pantoea sp. VS1]OWS75399.1 transcriptional regulator [Pantoea sp. VS1]
MRIATPDREIQLKALGNAQRMAVLNLLKNPAVTFSAQWSADPAEFGVCMSLIAENLGLSQPTVSRHLDILHRASFISVQKKHKWSYCLRNEEGIREFLNWLGKTL